MNKENRDKLIALKQSVVSDLHNIDVDSYKLDKADERLNVYIKGCINNPNAHNLYELLAVRRFFVFLDKYEFRIKEVKKFVTFYERLKFSADAYQDKQSLVPTNAPSPRHPNSKELHILRRPAAMLNYIHPQSHNSDREQSF